MKTLEVFDPAMCCSTGVCGVEVDPVLVACTADLQWLAAQGVTVRRYNLAQEPQAFTANPTVVRELEVGLDRLPLTLLDGRVIASGVYLTRAQLARVLGLAAAAAGSPLPVAVATVSATPEGGCC